MLRLFLLFCFFLPGVVSAGECLSTHHIFLIHGIGGSQATFGSMAEYLEKSNECYAVTSFEYDTGNSSLDTHDFAEDFFQLIQSKIQGGEISPWDKISLIMHSQGGIVGSLWMNKISQDSPEVFSQVDSFITLSTPFWGSDMARLGQRVFFTLPPGMENPISPFGSKELNEMSYGSETIRELSFLYKKVFPFRGIRALAIGGIHQGIKKLFGETDIAVPVYSSRPDHYGLNHELNLNLPVGIISSTLFTKSKSVPFLTVPAAHIKLDIPGVADLPRKCLRSEKCDHPSIRHITGHLAGLKPAEDSSQFRSFRIQLYVNRLTEQGLRKEDVEVQFGSDRKKYRAPASLEDDVAFTYEGKLESEKSFVMLKVKIADTVERVIEVPVEGGFSTLLHLNLQK